MKVFLFLAVTSVIGIAAFASKDARGTDAQASDTSVQTIADEDITSLLDGKAFIIDCYDAKNDDGMTDTLRFADGTCHSSACTAYGFTKADYSVTRKGEDVVFTATTISSSHGRMEWQGTFDGEEITGDVVWTQEGEDPIVYDFSGPLQ